MDRRTWIINTILLILVICGVHALSETKPSWIKHKLKHEAVSFSTAWQKKLCKTDMDKISEYLDNVLVERRVDTRKHDKVRNYIVNTLRKVGYEVDTHYFTAQTPTGSKGFYNIIARQDGRAKRYLTLACHYDSKDCRTGFCEPGGKRFTFMGATDSALPCVLMLEIAAALQPYFKDSRYKELSLQLLFLDGEEAMENWSSADSIYGARSLVDHWQKSRYTEEDGRWHGATELDQIDVFVLLDLLGAANPSIANYRDNFDRAYNQIYQAEQKLRSLGCLREINQIFQPAKKYAFVEDDHVPFLRQGVPIVHLIPMPFPSVWHREEDNRQYLHMDTVHNLAAIFRLFVAEYLHLDLGSKGTCESGPCTD